MRYSSDVSIIFDSKQRNVGVRVWLDKSANCRSSEMKIITNCFFPHNFRKLHMICHNLWQFVTICDNLWNSVTIVKMGKYLMDVWMRWIIGWGEVKITFTVLILHPSSFFQFTFGNPTIDILNIVRWFLHRFSSSLKKKWRFIKSGLLHIYSNRKWGGRQIYPKHKSHSS